MPTEPTLRRRARWAVPATVAILVLGSNVLPATGQAAPEPTTPPTAEQQEAVEATLALKPEEPSSPDDLFVDIIDADAAVVEAALVRLDAASRSREADIALLLAAGDEGDAQADWDRARTRKNRALTTRENERDTLRDLTVRAYVSGGDIPLEEYHAIMDGDTTDPGAGRELMFTRVIDRQKIVTDEAVADLAAARTVLAARKDDLTAAETETAARRATAVQRAGDKLAAEDAHAEAQGAAASARADLRTAGSRSITLVPEGVSLIGMPRLSAEDLAGWFRAKGYSTRVSTPIEDYARWFIEEGAAEGIRGDIAFAQAVLETGGFNNNDSVFANNFSGIGHCDLCPSGWVFPSPQAGVRAQIQLLKSYAVRTPLYANPLVDRRLRGPAGCCPTWGDLTTVWATDPTYAPKVMLIYSTILEYAFDRRAAGGG